MTDIDFITSGTLNVIADIFNEPKNKYSYYANLRNASETENDEVQKKVLKTLSEIMSYAFNPKDKDVPFSAMLTYKSLQVKNCI
jgi:hypothetical protein